MMRAGTFTNLAAVTSCIVSPAFAAPDRQAFKRQVDAFVEQEMRREKIPGASIAILHKGDVVLAKGYGIANVEHDVPVSPDTIFQLGSVGKMFTAAAVMRLVEQGTLKLDDPIARYIRNAPASWRPITIRHLLTHTSGIANVEDDFDFKRAYTDDQLIRAFAALPLNFTPGARYSYSNSGYILLGIIIERASGRFYGDILRTDVFAPLGMKTARVISDRDIVVNRAAGYEIVNGSLKNQEFVSEKMNSTADGSLYASLHDMIAWTRGVEQGRVLSATSWKQVYAPVRLNSGKTYPYGFGWGVDSVGGKPVYGHSGSWQGFRSHFIRYLGDDLAIIVLANSAEANTRVFVEAIAKLWDPELVAVPRPAPEPAVAQRVEALIATARSGRLAPADIPLASSSDVRQLAPRLAKRLQDLGSLGGLELVDRSETGDDVNYVFSATFANGTAKVHYSLAPGNRVSDFAVTL